MHKLIDRLLVIHPEACLDLGSLPPGVRASSDSSMRMASLSPARIWRTVFINSSTTILPTHMRFPHSQI